MTILLFAQGRVADAGSAGDRPIGARKNGQGEGSSLAGAVITREG
jgi:hypothetical protein